MHSLEKTQTNNKIFKINMNPNQMRQFSTLVINEVVTQREQLSLSELIFPWQRLKSRTILSNLSILTGMKVRGVCNQFSIQK